MVIELFLLGLASVPVFLYIFVDWFQRGANSVIFFIANFHVMAIELFSMWPPAPTYARYKSIVEVTSIRNADGTRSYFGKWGSGKKVLFWLHGNAMNIGDDFFYKNLAQKMDVTIIAPEFHGYCPDTFKVQRPTFKKSVYNFLSVYMYLTRDMLVTESDIVIIGHSLGTGLALKMLNDPFCNPSKLILISPFLSLMSVVHYVLAAVLKPFDQLKSYEEVRKLKVPTLIVHGSADALISIDHGYELNNLIPPNYRANMLVVVGATHNSMFSCSNTDLMIDGMKKFIDF